MPRTTNQVKVKVLLPAQTLNRLSALAQNDGAPLAEVIRRLCDLAVTFDFPPLTMQINEDETPPSSFVIHIPEPLLDRFSSHAEGRRVTFDSHLAAVATVYLAKRARETHRVLAAAL